MTPADFQSSATAWIGAGVVVLGGLTAAVVKLVTYAIPAIEQLRGTVGVQQGQIIGQQGQLDTHMVAIHANAMAIPSAVPVVAPLPDGVQMTAGLVAARPLTATDIGGSTAAGPIVLPGAVIMGPDGTGSGTGTGSM